MPTTQVSPPTIICQGVVIRKRGMFIRIVILLAPDYEHAKNEIHQQTDHHWYQEHEDSHDIT
jgi:hypothetical protein